MASASQRQRLPVCISVREKRSPFRSTAFSGQNVMSLNIQSFIPPTSLDCVVLDEVRD